MKNKILLQRVHSYQKEMKLFYQKIRQYDRIVVYRHNHPDYDALGTQLGLVEFLKTNYPNKEIHYVGDDHVTLTGKCFPKMEVLPKEWFDQEFLAIFVDTSRFDRVGLPNEFESFKKASYIVKIDHHPNVDPYGNLQIVDVSMAAAGELMANILILSGKKISKNCGEYLYKAIVGDSGRFLYESTTENTFEVSRILIKTGLDLSKIYQEMYDQKLEDLEITAYILDHYKITPHGVAYYVLDDQTLKKLKLPPERGKENVNLFAHLDGIHAWMSITEDVQKGEWRVSIRSAKESIEDIATKYHGGGHPQAAGCKIKSFDEIPNLIADLDNLFAK